MNRVSLLACVTALALSAYAVHSTEVLKTEWADSHAALPVTPAANLFRAFDPVERKIIDLPEDGEVWHTSLFLHDDWESIERERRLVAWFDVDDRLASLKAQTKWHLYVESDAIYHERFAKSIPILPAVVVQEAQGDVVYKASSHGIPDTSAALARGIQGTICRKCKGPWCQPDRTIPAPTPPKPDVPDTPFEPIPDIGPPDLSGDVPKTGNDLVFALILVAGSVGLGVALQWKRTG